MVIGAVSQAMIRDAAIYPLHKKPETGATKLPSLADPSHFPAETCARCMSGFGQSRGEKTERRGAWGACAPSQTWAVARARSGDENADTNQLVSPSRSRRPVTGLRRSGGGIELNHEI
jgi:hypothetical protein